MTLGPGMPRAVRIVEVGPRDGLQNEDAVVPAAAKVSFIEALADAGLQVVEATSFVSPRAVPQLADADEMFPRIGRREGVRYPVLVPNMRGMERAERAGADAVAVFTAASEAFTERNIGMTIAESLDAFEPVLDRARALGWWRRGYVSTAFGCPYSGAVDPRVVVEVCVALTELGCEEISVGDTIGVAEPDGVRRVCDAVLEHVPVERLALHLHDTHGRALENVVAGLERGVQIYDASAGGTGGCPFAPGAPGNLATESLCGLLDRLGIEHGVDADRVAAAAAALRAMMDRGPTG
ncbi:MAG TPA: hydroxymethylglutaryl-CoA lyase [Actinomycetota bacterium]|jgi:isopropylmalate/homocitrate/citramalate synthase|nr:hydroxymethylglutaryl-CoA lyase [Actinomycetota bacterium]